MKLFAWKYYHANTCILHDTFINVHANIYMWEFNNWMLIISKKIGEKKLLTYEVSTIKAENLLIGTPKSVKKIFDLLKKSNKPLKVNELQKLTNLTDRTIRLALNTLYNLNLVVKIPNLEDLRSHFLTISPGIA